MRPYSIISCSCLLSTADSAFTSGYAGLRGDLTSWGFHRPDTKPSKQFELSQLSASSSSSSGDDNPNSIDVSDLGLTMDDLNASLPPELLQSIETAGYDSTSMIDGDRRDDEGCRWSELPERMKATLAIPGLRGQPPMCLSVLTSTSTVSVTAFGRVVWSCVLRGKVKPETAVFEAKDGPDMVPTIDFEVMKADADDRWGGFILQIGEDSIV